MEIFRLGRHIAKILYWSLILIFIAALSACSDSSDSPAPAPIVSPPTGPLCSVANTQLIVDMTTPVAGYTWNDPHVIKEGPTTYWMYASATDSFIFPVQLFRFGSSDGVTWALDPGTQNMAAPMLAAGGAPLAWDDGGAETPAVVFFNGNYHLFYTTYETHPDNPLHSSSEFRIGHAVSADGVSGWVVDSTPLVSPSGVYPEFDESVVAEPAPVVFNGELYLYFTAIGVNLGVGSTLQVIGLTKSADGTTWSSPVSVLEPSQSIYPRGSGWIGYSTPNAIAHNGEVHLFVDVANEIPSWLQVRLHHARSADGETGWITDARPLLIKESFPWTAREIRSPSPLDDNGTLKLYFAGDNFPGTDFGIGLTNCPSLSW